MSNVLIGIVGVILFIALALVGAFYFGPSTRTSIDEAGAQGSARSLAAVASAVSVHDREMEATTPSGTDSSALVPDYLPSVQRNPVNGESIVLLDVNGSTTGRAAFAATRMPSDHPAMCEFLSRSGGGPVPVASLTAPPSQRLGCVRLVAAIGTYQAGDLLAFARIK